MLKIGDILVSTYLLDKKLFELFPFLIDIINYEKQEDNELRNIIDLILSEKIKFNEINNEIINKYKNILIIYACSIKHLIYIEFLIKFIDDKNILEFILLLILCISEFTHISYNSISNIDINISDEIKISNNYVDSIFHLQPIHTNYIIEFILKKDIKLLPHYYKKLINITNLTDKPDRKIKYDTIKYIIITKYSFYELYTIINDCNNIINENKAILKNLKEDHNKNMSRGFHLIYLSNSIVNCQDKINKYKILIKELKKEYDYKLFNFNKNKYILLSNLFPYEINSIIFKYSID